MKNNFPLSQKYIDFINSVSVSADFLEGTTASGKTTVGAGVKFMRMVSASAKKLHVIAAKTVGKAEETIIQQDNGILDLHTNARYCGNGDKNYKLPHIKFEDKIIYILGYDDKNKWQMALGAQFGCVYIDEVNTADIEFVREMSTRNDYLMATLNPDDPSLPVYKEFVNRSRPYKKYKNDIPLSIREELCEEPVPGWRYWFFSFADNLSLSAEEIEKKKASAPKGTKLYKNKILGERGKASGLVFPHFDTRRHVKGKSWAKAFLPDERRRSEEHFVIFTSGLDTAYSQQSPDTVSMVFAGITSKGRFIQLDERAYNNTDLAQPLAPSDISKNYFDFLERNRSEWGFARNTFIDSADQATRTELLKFKRSNACLYVFNNAWKKVQIIDRIMLVSGWLKTGHWFILEGCANTIHEFENYAWDEKADNTPEDKNDHCINAGQYAFIPYRDKIGDIENGADKQNGR